MGIRNMVKGLKTPVDELDRQRVQGRFEPHREGRVALSECPLRQKVEVIGEVSRMRVVPRAGCPSLEIVVSDGSGEATAVFHGRRRIKGIGPGQAIALCGVARQSNGRMVFLNPAYTLLA
ncbi:MAG: OB-fold nucleic acid binding domain-containing protein [Actinobacteria bacterium]|nr:OB-fold nucleic acid binding domain-containing protein [Actinomycetota bacterium]MBI3256591.1 OB-fold nucleic acid binding domain-containing protein [Actinomycetota bacterium]